MIPYKLEDQSFNLPESWNEITVKQWLELRNCDFKDICKILAVLTGIDESMWFNTHQIDVVEKMIPNLEWIHTAVDLSSLPVAEKIMLSGKEVIIPKDITLKTFGQKLTFQQMMLQHLDKSGEVRIEFMPTALAIYLCDDPFSDEKVAALISEVEKLPITTAYPVAAFFLTNFLKSFQTKESTFSRRHTNLNK